MGNPTKSLRGALRRGNLTRSLRDIEDVVAISYWFARPMGSPRHFVLCNDISSRITTPFRLAMTFIEIFIRRAERRSGSLSAYS